MYSPSWVLALGGTLVLAIGLAIGAQEPHPKPGARTPVDSQRAAAGQRYRYRVLGVYDEVTGEPLEGVEVSDALSGLSSLTTKTGTVSLLFLPDGGSLIRLRKLGYEVQTFPVTIAPIDTAPLTIIM